MPWIRKQLRGKRIWAHCDKTGKLRPDEQKRVDVIYQPGGRIYQALLVNLTADEEVLILTDEEAQPGARADALLKKKIQKMGERLPIASSKNHLEEKWVDKAPKDAVRVFTDGACRGNPGPMGIGVVILDPLHGTRREFSEYLGRGTNNIAELTAIQKGLEHAPYFRPVVVYSDSAYAIGVLFQQWKARANQELIENLRKLIQKFSNISWIKVLGHAGIPENERCDELARMAIQSGSNQ